MIIERRVRLGLRAPHDARWSYAPWASYGGYDPFVWGWGW